MSIGFFFDFGDDAMTASNDEKRGRELLNHFYSYAKSEFPMNMPYKNLDEMLSQYGRISATISEGLGLAQRSMDLSYEQASSSMENLANAGQGRLPQNWNNFFDALKNKGMNPGWFDTLKFVSWESTKDAKDVVVGVGEGFVSTLKMGKYTLPVLIYGGAGLFIYFMARGFGKSSEKIGSAIGD